MPKPRRTKTLVEQLADLDAPAPKDFDPEEPDTYVSGSEDSGSDGGEAADGREHYVDVGKSKLRKRDVVPLGPRYEGSRVSRDAVEDEEDSDDPFSKGFDDGSTDEDEEEDPAPNGVESDEDEDEGDNGLSDEEGDNGEDGSGSEEDGDGTSATDFSDEDEDEDEEMEDARPDKAAVNRVELRKIMNEEQKTVAATISEAAKADAEKGRAVKSQRKTFDSLLNTRIRLQKALVATNSMFEPQAQSPDSPSDNDDPVRAAEEAACNLWNSLNNLRESLHTARTGEKRKRVELSTSTPAQEMWNHMRSYETTTLPHRQTVLEKWSAKARGVSALPTKARLNNTTQQTIVDMLSSQLADSSRLVQKTRMPRSCAPLQAAAGVPESAAIFDDADFYGLLLKELLERRSEESATGTLAGMSFNVPHWQAAREAKTRRHVDTRASKGRKLRYTVHEKLQNFMAPEDRGVWGDRQADELFGSLFGRKVGLAEELEEDDERASEDEDFGEQGLLLFGGGK